MAEGGGHEGFWPANRRFIGKDSPAHGAGFLFSGYDFFSGGLIVTEMITEIATTTAATTKGTQ